MYQTITWYFVILEEKRQAKICTVREKCVITIPKQQTIIGTTPWRRFLLVASLRSSHTNTIHIPNQNNKPKAIHIPIQNNNGVRYGPLQNNKLATVWSIFITQCSTSKVKIDCGCPSLESV
jgi:hypothetical protein